MPLVNDANVDRVIGMIRQQDDKLRRLKVKMVPNCGEGVVQQYQRWRTETGTLISKHIEDEIKNFESIEKSDLPSKSRLGTLTSSGVYFQDECPHSVG